MVRGSDVVIGDPVMRARLAVEGAAAIRAHQMLGSFGGSGVRAVDAFRVATAAALDRHRDAGLVEPSVRVVVRVSMVDAVAMLEEER